MSNEGEVWVVEAQYWDDPEWILVEAKSSKHLAEALTTRLSLNNQSAFKYRVVHYVREANQ